MKHFLLEISEICKNFGDLSQKNSDFDREKRRITAVFPNKTKGTRRYSTFHCISIYAVFSRISKHRFYRRALIQFSNVSDGRTDLLSACTVSSGFRLRTIKFSPKGHGIIQKSKIENHSMKKFGSSKFGVFLAKRCATKVVVCPRSCFTNSPRPQSNENAVLHPNVMPCCNYGKCGSLRCRRPRS